MNELIQAWTRAGLAVAAYFEKCGNPVLSVVRTGPETVVDTPAPAEPKPRKPRAVKATDTVTLPEAPAAGAAVVLPGSATEMSEDDSLKEVRAVAKAFVQRFANQVDGITAFRKLMSDTCKVGKIDDLVHAQRLQVITAAKAEILKADAPKPAAAPSLTDI